MQFFSSEDDIVPSLDSLPPALIITSIGSNPFAADIAAETQVPRPKPELFVDPMQCPAPMTTMTRLTYLPSPCLSPAHSPTAIALPPSHDEHEGLSFDPIPAQPWSAESLLPTELMSPGRTYSMPVLSTRQEPNAFESAERNVETSQSGEPFEESLSETSYLNAPFMALSNSTYACIQQEWSHHLKSNFILPSHSLFSLFPN
jgi:hypothetical protein